MDWAGPAIASNSDWRIKHGTVRLLDNGNALVIIHIDELLVTNHSTGLKSFQTQQQQLALLIINRGRDTALWERRSSRRGGGGVRSSCAYPVFANLCVYALLAISGLLIQSLLSVG
jgi:hypothetical protein